MCALRFAQASTGVHESVSALIDIAPPSFSAAIESTIPLWFSTLAQQTPSCERGTIEATLPRTSCTMKERTRCAAPALTGAAILEMGASTAA